MYLIVHIITIIYKRSKLFWPWSQLTRTNSVDPYTRECYPNSPKLDVAIPDGHGNEVSTSQLFVGADGLPEYQAVALRRLDGERDYLP